MAAVMLHSGDHSPCSTGIIKQEFNASDIQI